MSNREVKRWHTISRRDFRRFINLSGDKNPIHTDTDFARAMHGESICQEPIVHGALIFAKLSADVWLEYDDGATAAGVDEQTFRFPVEVGEQVGFNYEELEGGETTIGKAQWPAMFWRVRITPYKRVGDRELRLGGVICVVVVPTPESLMAIREETTEAKRKRRRLAHKKGAKAQPLAPASAT